MSATFHPLESKMKLVLECYKLFAYRRQSPNGVVVP